MTDAVKLKPCPFCGGDELSHGHDMGRGVVQCHSCDAFVAQGDEYESIAAWNTRAEAAPSPDAVKIEPVGHVNSKFTGAMGRIQNTREQSVMVSVFKNEKLAIELFGETTPLYGQNAMDRIKELEAWQVARATTHADAFALITRNLTQIVELREELGATQLALEQTERNAARAIEDARRKALEEAEFGFDQIHKALMSNGPKQASGEVANHFLEKTRDTIRALIEKEA